jgi:hypothetical protein
MLMLAKKKKKKSPLVAASYQWFVSAESLRTRIEPESSSPKWGVTWAEKRLEAASLCRHEKKKCANRLPESRKAISVSQSQQEEICKNRCLRLSIGFSVWFTENIFSPREWLPVEAFICSLFESVTPACERNATCLWIDAAWRQLKARDVATLTCDSVINSVSRWPWNRE